MYAYILLRLLMSSRLLSHTQRLSMTRNAVWCLSNLSRGKAPPPDFAKVSIGTFPGRLYNSV